MDCSSHLIPTGFTAPNPHSVLCSEWSSFNTNRGMSSFYSLLNLLNKFLKGPFCSGSFPLPLKNHKIWPLPMCITVYLLPSWPCRAPTSHRTLTCSFPFVWTTLLSPFQLANVTSPLGMAHHPSHLRGISSQVPLLQVCTTPYFTYELHTVLFD